jgi:ribosomal protein S17E
MGAYVDAIYNANFELMEEVSKMSDMAATLNKTLENAGYVTRKMILAGIQAKEEKAREIAQNLISRGFDMKETAEITGMDIEKVRALSEQ